MMKRLAAVVLAAAFAVAAVGHRAGLQRPLVLRAAAANSPLLGLDYGRTGSQVWLARLDPKTLKTRPGRRLGLDQFVGGWGYSPDRSLLAFGSRSGNSLDCCPARVRIVNARTLRTVRELSLGVTGEVPYLHWAAPERLLALVRSADAERVVVADPATGTVRASNELDGTVSAAARADHALVLLLEGKRYGPVRLLVAGYGGSLASVALDRIEAGTVQLPDDVLRQERAAVAVDRTGNRAYVVAPAGNLVAEVDLATLAADYRVPAQPVSLLRRLDRWLEPEAQAKGPVVGSRRSAVWLGEGRLAYFGTDASTYPTADSLQMRERPSGLIVIDTGSWTARMVDPRSSSLVVANGTLLSWGSGWDSGTQRLTGAGLYAYDPAGLQRFHLFGRRVVVDVQVVGSRAFVSARNLYRQYAIVSLGTGHLLRTVRGEYQPLVLAGPGSAFVD